MRKNKYIPHLAEFYFAPDESMSVEEAAVRYNSNNNTSTDIIHYKDCIAGMEALPESSIDLVIADPPFGIDFSGKESIYNRNADNVVNAYHEIDAQTYCDFSEAWIGKLFRVLKKTGSVYIVSGYTNLESILRGIRKAKLTVINHCIWQYQFGVFCKRKFVSSHYHIILAVKNKSYYFNRIKHYLTDVWTDIPRTYKPNELKNGTKLPEDLVKRCIDYSSRPGDLILDPFMGNGTTAVVAKKNYRHFLGFEQNLKMKKIISLNLTQAILGEMYHPYGELIPTPEQLKDIDGYQSAYKVFLKQSSAEEFTNVRN